LANEISEFQKSDNAGWPADGMAARMSQRVARMRPMTGSPKQSIAPQQASVDCFVAEFVVGPAEGGTHWLLAITKIQKARHCAPFE
jgi:hypothetical protein